MLNNSHTQDFGQMSEFPLPPTPNKTTTPEINKVSPASKQRDVVAAGKSMTDVKLFLSNALGIEDEDVESSLENLSPEKWKRLVALK